MSRQRSLVTRFCGLARLPTRRSVANGDAARRFARRGGLAEEKVRRIRTDLNRFSDDEMASLVMHGYAVARLTFAGVFADAPVVAERPSTPIWTPVKAKRQRMLSVDVLAKRLDAGRRRGIGLWNPRNWTSWAIMSIVGSLPMIFVGSILLNIVLVKGATPGEVVSAFYASDRASTDGATSNDRSKFAQFGIGAVTIPRDHRFGAVESPSPLSLLSHDDPTRYVTLVKTQSMDMPGFLAKLHEVVIAGKPARVLLFVPGFNSDFASSIKKGSTLAYDLAVDGPIVAFSPKGQIIHPVN